MINRSMSFSVIIGSHNMEAEKFHDLLYASFRLRKASEFSEKPLRPTIPLERVKIKESFTLNPKLCKPGWGGRMGSGIGLAAQSLNSGVTCLKAGDVQLQKKGKRTLTASFCFIWPHSRVEATANIG